MSAACRVLVVDDEPLARAGMAALVAREPGFAVAGECDDGLDALAAWRSLEPDVVLLDVQMPGLDGFEVLARAAPLAPAQVVFVTAFEQHAVRAFEVAAADYVLKPFDDARFRAALARAVARGRPEPLLVAGPPSARVLVRASELDWIEAADYCVRLHVGAATHLLRAPLDDLARRLDRKAFVRIHRGALVRLAQLAEVARDRRGRTVARLRDGSELPVSRRGRTELANALRTISPPDRARA